MAEEQSPVLQETQNEESPQMSKPVVQESHTSPEETSAVEDKTKEDTTQDNGLNGLDEEHQTEEQTVKEKGDIKVKEEEKGEGEDTGTSSGDVPEDSVTSDGGKAVTGAKEENSSTQEEGGDDLSSHESKPEAAAASSLQVTEDSVTSDGGKSGTGAKEENSSTQEEGGDDLSSHESKPEAAAASSPQVPAVTEGEDRSKEERTQPSAKDSADKVDNSKPAPSSAKAGVAATTSKEAAHDKERDKKSEIPRARTMPKSYGRATKKDIAEKFGGVATSGIRVQRSTSCGAGAVKNMLLQWCQAKTRGREGVEIENFSSSWSSGLAFCALIVAFFPDAFDYDSLDPKNRRENFQLAFSAAEKYADCPPLLDVEDMVRMKVPDSKCVYTYVQELYRSLVAKGLVKTKKA